MDFSKSAKPEVIGRASEALAANGFNVVVVETGAQAKQEVLNLIPKNAEVMTMTSVTLDSIGIAKAINDSGDYDSVRLKLNTMNRATQGRDMQKLGAAPTYTIGSVHAITQDGKVVIASNTGSQLPAYAYGASKVIWVVGAQKIVKNLDEAMKRIYDYVLPLESERAKKAYGAPGSFVSKLLIVNKEVAKDRITIVIVKEPLGF
jgi:L-lactate utilization protein LutC